jgi:hypothetical protein
MHPPNAGQACELHLHSDFPALGCGCGAPLTEALRIVSTSSRSGNKCISVNVLSGLTASSFVP